MILYSAIIIRRNVKKRQKTGVDKSAKSNFLEVGIAS
jgi:hypothetical protein